MLCTIQMNLMGHLHIWKGVVNPIRMGKYNYEVKQKDTNWKAADLYIQTESGICCVIDSLNNREIDRLTNGFAITVDCESIII